MLKKILLGLLAVIAVFLAIVASRPATYELKRSVDVAATPEVISAQITNFKKWEAWSPWEKKDSAMKKTYDGAAEGVDAHYAWNSEKVGSGEMKITDVKPEKIGIDLHFTAPFESRSRVDFDLAKSGDKTSVTWTMSGKNDFSGKAASLFFDMEKNVGPDFESGLASLKEASEKAQAAVVVAPPPAEAPPEAVAATDAGTP